MPHLSQVSHENPVISEKVNYFCNYFAQANQHIGQLPRFRFSCPSYVIGSVLFQLTYNRGKCIPYIGNLLEGLVEFDLEIIDQASEKEHKLKLIASLTSAAKRKDLGNELKKSGNRLVKFIKVIHDQLLTNELTIISEYLASNLGCGHKLVTHKKYLEHLAIALVSIYRFNGFDKRRTRENFNAIFSSSIFQYPFPSHINEIEEKGERISRKEEYLSNRKFKDHFTAITDSVNRKTYSPFVIILLMNIELREGNSLDFEFNGVRTVDPSHEKVVEMIKRLAKVDPDDVFFDHENYAACIFQVDTKTNVGDFRGDIYAKAQTVADYLNTRLDSTQVIVNRSKYLQTLDFEHFSSGWSSIPPTAKIHKFKTRLLEDNASNYLKTINDQLKYPLLYTEQLFWEGKRNKDLVKLWQCLENTTPEEDSGKRKVCRTVRNILLYRKSQLVDALYSEDLINVLSNMSPYNKKEFSPEMVKRLREREGYLNIYEATKHSGNPFIRSLGQHWRSDRKRVNDAVFAAHYNDILIEARAFRNMVLHDGNFNPALKTKLETCLPYVVTKYRFQCIDLVLTNKKRRDYLKLISLKVNNKDY